MKNIAIVGGKLQGVEAVYLGKKAGYKVTLIDKKNDAPARDMADRFICKDVTFWDDEVAKAFMEADMILPANENYQTLAFLDKIAKENNLPLLFDIEAYNISMSKVKSDKLFLENQVDAPQYYPKGEPPYIAKPSCESGSKDVILLKDRKMVEDFLEEHKIEDWVIQEFITGPSYSVEVIGKDGNYKTYETTEIHMDEVYDCNLVTVDRNRHKPLMKDLEEIGIKIAKLINLNGIMDLEVIENNGHLKTLEIDARMPSQTPIAVYFATGINYIEELMDLIQGRFEYESVQSSDPLLCERGLSTSQSPSFAEGESLISKNLSFAERATGHPKYVSFEPLKIECGEIKGEGEHIMSGKGPLHVELEKWGSKEAITNYALGKDCWVANVVSVAETREELETKRKIVRENIIKESKK